MSGEALFAPWLVSRTDEILPGGLNSPACSGSTSRYVRACRFAIWQVMSNRLPGPELRQDVGDMADVTPEEPAALRRRNP